MTWIKYLQVGYCSNKFEAFKMALEDAVEVKSLFEFGVIGHDLLTLASA
jgi:hypothetical protein